MKQADRERAVSYLTQTRDNLLRATRGLSPAQLEFKAAPGRWSVANCLEHIVVVENFFFDKMEEALKHPPDLSKRSAFDGRDDELLQIVTDRTSPRQAPDVVQPASRWPHDQLVREFDAVRNRTIELATGIASDPRQHFFPHRAFGELDCYQWLLLVAAHGDRHRAQIEEVIAAPNFPRTAAAV